MRNEAPSHVSPLAIGTSPGKQSVGFWTKKAPACPAVDGDKARALTRRLRVRNGGVRYHRKEGSKFLLKPERNLSRHARTCEVKTEGIQRQLEFWGEIPPKLPLAFSEEPAPCSGWNQVNDRNRSEKYQLPFLSTRSCPAIPQQRLPRSRLVPRLRRRIASRYSLARGGFRSRRSHCLPSVQSSTGTPGASTRTPQAHVPRRATGLPSACARGMVRRSPDAPRSER